MSVQIFAHLILLLAAFAPSVQAATEAISITPDNLEELLFSGSTDVAKEMNNVLRAKSNVDVAYGSLIPSLSLNLGVVVASPPLFLISSVSCLVPFLFPSSWYGYGAAKKEALAEAAAFEITKLNAFASAYVLLSHFSNDEAVLAVLTEQYRRVDEYVQSVKEKAGKGLLPQLDAWRAEFELRKMRLDVSRLDETIGIERAVLRKMLGLNIEQAFQIQFADEQPSRLEQEPLTQPLVFELFNQAPEHRQLELLLASARERVKASSWAFLAGCAGSSQGNWGPSTTNGFSFSSTFSVSIGYGNFPQISLSRRNVDDISIREKELLLELGRLLESTVKSITQQKLRLEEAAKAVELGERILIEQTRLADQGKASRKDLLDTANGIARTKIEYLNARSAIEGHRITLKRMNLEGKFSDILLKARRTRLSSPFTGRKGA